MVKRYSITTEPGGRNIKNEIEWCSKSADTTLFYPVLDVVYISYICMIWIRRE